MYRPREAATANKDIPVYLAGQRKQMVRCHLQTHDRQNSQKSPLEIKLKNQVPAKSLLRFSQVFEI